jgi:hypothetical protein
VHFSTRLARFIDFTTNLVHLGTRGDQYCQNNVLLRSTVTPFSLLSNECPHLSRGCSSFAFASLMEETRQGVYLSEEFTTAFVHALQPTTHS